jgi:hypothetical protein
MNVPFFKVTSGLITAFLLLSLAVGVSAQRRDFLSEAEVEIVREAQDIDTRIDVLLRMADRRFYVLGIDVKGWKDAGKTSDIWGELPKGSRTDLFNDIKRIVQKAVDDIDNLSSNPDAAPIREKGDKEAKNDHKRFPKAVRNLASGADRYMGPLKAELDRSTNEAERGLIISTLELCEQIIEAVKKLPAEVKTEGKKEKN